MRGRVVTTLSLIAAPVPVVAIIRHGQVITAVVVARKRTIGRLRAAEQAVEHLMHTVRPLELPNAAMPWNVAWH